jgi:hypothetical protein
VARDCPALCRRAAENEIDRNASPFFAQHGDEFCQRVILANFSSLHPQFADTRNRTGANCIRRWASAILVITRPRGLLSSPGQACYIPCIPAPIWRLWSGPTPRGNVGTLHPNGFGTTLSRARYVTMKRTLVYPFASALILVYAIVWPATSLPARRTRLEVIS